MAEASQSLLGVLKTGDILLVAPPALLRWLPGRLGRRSWQHVALVVRDAEPPGADGLGGRAGRRGRARGPPAAARQAPAAARRPDRRAPAQPGARARACARLAAWRAGLAARQSERSLLDLMAAGEDGWLGGEQASLDAPLPAELVAQAYQRLGLLDGPERKGRPARTFAPRDFSEARGPAPPARLRARAGDRARRRAALRRLAEAHAQPAPDRLAFRPGCRAQRAGEVRAVGLDCRHDGARDRRSGARRAARGRAGAAHGRRRQMPAAARRRPPSSTR